MLTDDKNAGKITPVLCMGCGRWFPAEAWEAQRDAAMICPGRTCGVIDRMFNARLVSDAHEAARASRSKPAL